MRSVKIAELKARLSHHLRAVRRGHSLTLLDRNTPIARIVPYESGDGLIVRHAVGRLHDMKLPPPLIPDVDVVDILLEDRRKER